MVLSSAYTQTYIQYSHAYRFNGAFELLCKYVVFHSKALQGSGLKLLLNFNGGLHPMFTNALIHAKLYSVKQLPCAPLLVQGLIRLNSRRELEPIHLLDKREMVWCQVACLISDTWWRWLCTSLFSSSCVNILIQWIVYVLFVWFSDSQLGVLERVWFWFITPKNGI